MGMLSGCASSLPGVVKIPKTETPHVLGPSRPHARLIAAVTIVTAGGCRCRESLSLSRHAPVRVISSTTGKKLVATAGRQALTARRVLTKRSLSTPPPCPSAPCPLALHSALDA